jgi:hypothetical protein
MAREGDKAQLHQNTTLLEPKLKNLRSWVIKGIPISLARSAASLTLLASSKAS